MKFLRFPNDLKISLFLKLISGTKFYIPQVPGPHQDLGGEFFCHLCVFITMFHVDTLDYFLSLGSAAYRELLLSLTSSLAALFLLVCSPSPFSRATTVVRKFVGLRFFAVFRILLILYFHLTRAKIPRASRRESRSSTTQLWWDSFYGTQVLSMPARPYG